MQIKKRVIKKSLMLAIHLAIVSIVTLSIFPANIAISFEPEYDEKGFIINDPRYPASSNREDTQINDIDENELINLSNSLNEQPFQLEAQNVKSGELASCSDYYNFESIALDLKFNTSSFEPGDPVIIEGDITNSNSYPIVNATIYGRLVRKIENPVFRRASSITLDEFIIASDINLDAGASHSVDTIYQLPSDAVAGEYHLLLYVYNNKFNLSGLTHSESVYGGKIEFSISGNNKSYIYLDKTNIRVNGQSYDTLGDLERYDSGAVKIETDLVNETQTTKEIKVTYKLYRWDSTFENNYIQNIEETYTVNPGQKLPISYTVENANEPIYDIKIIASSVAENNIEAYKSIANIRFGINNIATPRLYFATLDSYPINKESNIVTCIYNTSEDIYQGPVKLVTTLKNNRGKQLGIIEYSGPIAGRVEGFISKLSSANFTKIITLESILYDNQGVEIDKVSISYDCQKINESLCGKNKNIFFEYTFIIMISIALVILASIIIKTNWNKIKNYFIKNK